MGTDDEGFVLAHMTGYDLDTAAAALNETTSPADALKALKAEQAGEHHTYSITERHRQLAEMEEAGEPIEGFHEGGFVSRQPFRMFADFVGGDGRRGEPVKVSQSFSIDAVEDVEHAKKTVGYIRDIIERNETRFAEVVLPGKYPDGNPKTAMGMKKPDLSVVPASALLHLATAMMNGSVKYGPYNYRDQPVSARTYVAAAMRHLLSYLDGEDWSSDTEEAGAAVHHLAHVMACCAILLDCTEVGTLNDNRPSVAGKAGQMVDRFNNLGTLKVA